MDDTIYKVAIAGFLHDVGKFAERANMSVSEDFLNNNASLYQPFYNNQYTHKHAVYTAAFIDHVEKLLPKEFNKGGWGLGDSFINLAAGHHKPETPLQWIIAMADRVSSGFDRANFENYNRGIGVRDYKKTRLLTIFEGISTDQKWEKDSLESYCYRYPLKELSAESIFPAGEEVDRLIDSQKAEKEYADLFLSFVDSLEKLSHRGYIPLWFEHFDSLFMIYTSHIPAATVGTVIPDVSLYDHSKATAALASAIYLYHQQNGTMTVKDITNYEDKKFLIVTGDFYGIQNFITSEGGSTQKASAKLLRGRSFAVSLITELAADMLCRKLGLTPISIVLNAAGKFTIIAPNTTHAIETIKSVEQRINDWLMRIYFGESAIGISFIEASPEDFVTQRFDDLWERLSKTLERKKYNKIDLQKFGGAVPWFLDAFNNKLSRRLCPFCGKRPSSEKAERDNLLGDEISSCTTCRDHIYLGTHLVKASRLAVTTLEAELTGSKLLRPIFDHYQVSLDVEGKLSGLAEKGQLLRYWDISPSENGGLQKEITVKFINGYVPFYDETDETDNAINRYLAGRKSEKRQNELFDMIKKEKGRPKTFHHLAKWALNEREDGKFTGIEALGVLKADVDHLGLVFGCGIKNNSLSRLATLSRQLNNYFTVYLPYVLSTNGDFRNTYTVFAGGDDLLLIGPWNRMIELACHINESFRRYVCHNPNITLSAGMNVNKPGEPVTSMYERAEEAVKLSKQSGRNSITLFGECVNWDNFSTLQEINKTLTFWLQDEIINNAMLFRLNYFAQMAKQEKQLRTLKEDIGIEEWECLKWRAKFKYHLARNVGKKLKGDEKKEAIKEVEKAAAWLYEYGGAFKIPLWQIIYNQR